MNNLIYFKCSCVQRLQMTESCSSLWLEFYL